MERASHAGVRLENRIHPQQLPIRVRGRVAEHKSFTETRFECLFTITVSSC